MMQIRTRGFMHLLHWSPTGRPLNSPPWLSATTGHKQLKFSQQKKIRPIGPQSWVVLCAAVHFKGCSELLKVVFSAKKRLNNSSTQFAEISHLCLFSFASWFMSRFYNTRSSMLNVDIHPQHQDNIKGKSKPTTFPTIRRSVLADKSPIGGNPCQKYFWLARAPVCRQYSPLHVTEVGSPRAAPPLTTANWLVIVPGGASSTWLISVLNHRTLFHKHLH